MSQVALPNEIQTKMTEKVREVIFDMIPEEKVNALIAQELAAFFEVESDFTFLSGSYQSSEKLVMKATPLRVLVHNEAHKFFRGKIEEFFKSDEFKSGLELMWVNNGQELRGDLSERHDQMFKEQLVNMAKALFSGVIYQAAEQAKSDVRKGMLNAGMPVHF